MASVGVTLRHHVEEKRFDVEIQSFVIEKQFGQQTQILTVHFVLFPIDFEDGNVIFSINLVTRWMAPHTFGQVSSQDSWAVGVPDWERGGVKTKQFMKLRKRVLNNCSRCQSKEPPKPFTFSCTSDNIRRGKACSAWSILRDKAPCTTF